MFFSLIISGIKSGCHWIKGKIMDSQEYTELTAVPEHDPNTMPAQVVAEPKQTNLLDEEEDEIRLEDVPF